MVRKTYGDYVLDFFYDQNGTPFMLLQNGNIYYYITNAQGDVIRLVDINGNTAASYRYDPYGKAISALGSHATINPLRYRGYVFDHETGLYYLQSRYYDPEIGRFINADDYPTTGQGLTGNNMFAYCGNNPIMRADDGGEFWHIVAGAAVGAVTSVLGEVISSVVTGTPVTAGKIIGAAIGGALSGGLTAAGVPYVLANAAGAAVSSITAGIIDGKSTKEIVQDTVISVTSSVVIDGMLGAAGKVARHAVRGKYLKLGPVGTYIKQVTYKPKYLNKKSVSTILADEIEDFPIRLPFEILEKSVIN